jgi:hypothetical protein
VYVILTVIVLGVCVGLAVKRPGLGSYLFLLASAGVVSLAYAYMYFRL